MIQEIIPDPIVYLRVRLDPKLAPFLVLFKWTWALMTSQHGARIITDSTETLPTADTGVEERATGIGVSSSTGEIAPA